MRQSSLATILAFATSIFTSSTVLGGTYNFQLNSVSNKMLELDYKISDIQFVAQEHGHVDVHQLCERAKASLNQAKISWEKIASAFGDKPWLASSSAAKKSVQKHLKACGIALQSVYRHPSVHTKEGWLYEYKTPIEACQSAFTNWQSACQSIWNWPLPRPVPSGGGGYHKRNLLAHQTKASKTELCPPGESACPISPKSIGFECIDINTELTSCGGCVSLNKGENCVEIPGAAGVGCKAGKCFVLSVQADYYLGHDNRPVLRRRRT
ncbi:hypothetical protein O181_031338 [Austropuccinia psidii MF-1]|uniref:Protein CPL1-like domain-containing protein n=1 Tax=Austropuccinia psidii MF-1 TaxID=1389203 RepID=A0A9Q3CZG8_9BASI|nr:hypothetical protein [Austropuccinia psidii MF-1]